MLRARLAREHDELLRADPLGVHVDDDLQAPALELAEAEVGHLDRLLLGRRQHDPGLGQHRRRPVPRRGRVHSQRDGPAALRRAVQRLERPGLAHRVVAAEQELALAGGSRR